MYTGMHSLKGKIENDEMYKQLTQVLSIRWVGSLYCDLFEGVGVCNVPRGVFSSVTFDEGGGSENGVMIWRMII